MASPTETEIQTQFNKIVTLLNETDQFLRSNSPNVQGMIDDYIDGQEGDFSSLSSAGTDTFRATAATLVSADMGRRMLDGHLRNYGKLKLFPETDPLQILDRLLVEFAEGSSRVTTRAITFDSVSAGGGNTGDGTINRLTVDRYGYPLEAVTVEAKTVRCINDRHSGTNVHAERFEIRGGPVPRDFVSGVVSPDRTGTLFAASADTSQTYLSNPSFNGYTGTAPDIDSITNWTETTAIGNFQIETSDVYRTAVHEGTTPGSVRFQDNDTLTQSFTIARPQLNRLTPYYMQVAFKRESSCDGTLTITCGGNSAAATLVAQSGWTILRLALDENLFLQNFNATTLTVTIALSGRSTGSLLVDDVVFSPMTLFDGSYWLPVGGATPFLVDDIFTLTDTATESILQRWLWRLYRKYLPSASGGSVTWSEPA